MRRILWVFAHQDDELAAAARILDAHRRGDEVWCAYLTDGAFKIPSEVRNAESLAALGSLGVARERVFFGTAPDGHLLEQLELALAWLETRVAAIELDEIGCLAWEGGHHDHDAAHLVGLALARRRGVDAYEVPLYNGVHAPGPWFRVLTPVGDGWTSSAVSLRDAMRIVSMTRLYPSQRSTMLGLLPEAIGRLVLLRRVHARRADPRRVHHPPHRGKLFYERRFGCPRERFQRETAPFIARYLGDERACVVCGGRSFTTRVLLPELSVEGCTSCGFLTSDIRAGDAVRTAYANIDDDAYRRSIALVRRKQASEILQLVGKRGGRWLDVGCGFGIVLDEARRAGFSISGIEPNADAVAHARELLGSDIVRQGTFEQLEPADVLSTLDVIEHLPPRELRPFAARVAQTGATWIIKVPSTEGLFFRVAHALLPFTRGAVRRLWQSDYEHPHTMYFDATTLRRFLESCGFEVVRTAYLQEVPSSTAHARLCLDPKHSRWQALLAVPVVYAINVVERVRGRSDALVVIAVPKGTRHPSLR